MDQSQSDAYRPKQTTPKSGSLLSTPKGITRPAYPTYTSTMALPNLSVPSTTKNCMYISDTAPHPISCCGGAANLLSLSMLQNT